MGSWSAWIVDFEGLWSESCSPRLSRSDSAGDPFGSAAPALGATVVVVAATVADAASGDGWCGLVLDVVALVVKATSLSV